MEVKKSVRQAIIDLGIKLSEKKINKVLKEKDSEIEKMISCVVKKIGGRKTD